MANYEIMRSTSDIRAVHGWLASTRRPGPKNPPWPPLRKGENEADRPFPSPLRRGGRVCCISRGVSDSIAERCFPIRFLIENPTVATVLDLPTLESLRD